MFCARLLKIPIRHIHFGTSGIVIQLPSMQPWQELLCAASGPISGLIPMLLLRYLPEAALCSLLLTFYNLIPIYPSDGTRILRVILSFLFRNSTVTILISVIATLACLFIILLGVYGTFFLRLGVLPLALGVFLLLRRKREKMP